MNMKMNCVALNDLTKKLLHQSNEEPCKHLLGDSPLRVISIREHPRKGSTESRSL